MQIMRTKKEQPNGEKRSMRSKIWIDVILNCAVCHNNNYVYIVVIFSIISLPSHDVFFAVQKAAFCGLLDVKMNLHAISGWSVI